MLINKRPSSQPSLRFSARARFACLVVGSMIPKHGGDIDLYVTPDNRDHLAEDRITFLVRLMRRIGEQKIDLVTASEQPCPIDIMARNNGVVLCLRH